MYDRINIPFSFAVRTLSFLLTLASSLQLLAHSFFQLDTPIHVAASLDKTPHSLPFSHSVSSTDGNNRKAYEEMSETTLRPFEGSKVSQVSPGMLLYEDVCVYSKDIYRSQNDGRRVNRKQLRIKSYTSDGQPLRASHAYAMYQPDPGNYDIALETFPSSLSEWEFDSEGVLEKEETLFALQLHHNPGHCISDMVFSLALDRHVRGDDATHFRRYVYATWPKILQTYTPDWCFELLREAAFIQPETGIVSNAKDMRACFSRLYVPIFGIHRFPINPSDTTAAETFRKISVMEHFLTHNFSNPELSYPVDALESLRSVLCRSLDIPCNSWRSDNRDSISNTTKILLYNRKGAPRRHWNNADQVKATLERDYQVSVAMLGEKWESMTLREQLSLYNSYSHIITVHGAHEANLIAVRPGTHVIEVQCMYRDDPRPDLELTDPRSAVEDPVGWYGPPSWFSIFSRRLGAQHFLYSETEGCTSTNGLMGIHRSTDLAVDLDQFSSFVASRFGLTRRGTLP